MRPSRVILSLLVVAVWATALASSAGAANRRVPFGTFGTVLDPVVTLNTTAPVLGQQMAVMARSGVESVRSNIVWSTTEVSRGVYSWGDTDKLVLASAEHGLSLLPIIEFTPQWASLAPLSSSYAFYPPASMADFSAFVTALVHRYGPQGDFWRFYPGLRQYAVHYWQIWNEPAGKYDWHGSPWPPTYFKLLRAGYNAVHAADHRAKVVLAAMVGLNGPGLKPWTEAGALYRLGAGRYFDVMAVNAYADALTVAQSAPHQLLGIAKVRATMRSHGDGRKPIWVTEVTWPAALGRIPRSQYHGFETTPLGQAERLSAYYSYLASHRSLGIARAFWYTWASTYSVKHTNPLSSTFAFAGLTSWQPGQPFRSTPALKAYARTAARLEGCRKSSVATRCL